MMPDMIDDRDEAVRVLDGLIERTGLPGLIGVIRPDADSVELVMLAREGEECEVELVGDSGEVVAVLHVDVALDHEYEWTVGLRGWRLADDVASIT